MTKTTFYKGKDQVSLTPQEAITFQGGSAADPYGGLVRSGWSQQAPQTQPTPQQQPPTDLTSMTNQITTPTTPQVPTDFQRIQAQEKNIGVFSDADLARIDAAGEAERDKFDALIARAQEERRQGMATATVRSGQRGGFESTQFAGQAAIPEQIYEKAEGHLQALRELGYEVDDTDVRKSGTFVGVGGALEKIKSAYDLNIQDLETKKLAAISAAKQAAQDAIRGEQSDAYDRAVKMYELAVKANQDAQEMTFKMNQELRAQKTADMTGIDWEQKQEDRAIENVVSTIVTLDENGDVIRPSDAELESFATSNNLDIYNLKKSINDRIDALNKMQREERKALTDEQAKRMELIKTTDDKGNVLTVARDKITGQEMWRYTEEGAGKTKTGPSMVNITYPRLTKEILLAADGKTQVGIAWSDPIRGTTVYKDMADNPIDKEEVIAKGYTTVKKSGSSPGPWGGYEEIGEEEDEE